MTLLCGGCGRTLGHLVGDATGRLHTVEGADTRGGVRYLRPAPTVPCGGRPRGPAAPDAPRFYCADRCGMRYALPRAELAALFAQAVTVAVGDPAADLPGAGDERWVRLAARRRGHTGGHTAGRR
ncbi:hypothetical protein ACFFOU_05470 [Pseudonocardia sulfidoxydans]|uniref:hypothetical protein n=1 Tax=Pseudonocardia sulfidoxydans TaxID=54011 RepID=UPI0011BF7E44|nr:hypothetical protein [Pseudonocardia sulfidoxydans]